MMAHPLDVQIRQVWSLRAGAPEPAALYGVGSIASGAQVLVPVADANARSATVSAARCIEVPSTLRDAAAKLVPPLAIALWIWDTLELELGDCAVICGNHPYDFLLAQAALWRGASPVVHLDLESSGNTAPAGIERLRATDSSAMHAQLAECIRRGGGYAAVDLSGRPDVLDVVFETIPREARLMMASQAGAPVTIDFYNNVHRKGIRMESCMLDTALVFDGVARGLDQHVARAIRILLNDKLAERCLASVN
jgi:threonine dehydrogenase-like Zn-dependent dehydrogenase